MPRRFIVALGTAAFVVAVPLSMSAQRTAKRIFVSAVDDRGEPVVDLTTTEFHITENGVTREVTRATLGTAPMRVVLMVDSSSAIQPMMVSFRNGLNAFVDALPPEHEVAFVTSGGQIRVRTQPSTTRDPLKTAIGLLAAEGGANAFLETLIESDQRFLKSASDRWPVFVILTTDMADSQREPDVARYNKFMNDFLSRGGNAHAVLMAGKRFGPVTDLTMNLVQNLGGIYTSLVADSGLPERLTAIARRLAEDHLQMRDRYEVEFTGEAKAVQATVNVSVTRDGVMLDMSARRPF
ncbi:MAG: hypothetical protein ABI039_10815 [Vicinamibacterales bacterium]